MSLRPELKGLQSPVENSVPITFHVLVPLLLWDWDFSSHMHIRFGHKDLGSWEENCGDMTVHRYICIIILNGIRFQKLQTIFSTGILAMAGVKWPAL